jgi:hypothetical protein
MKKILLLALVSLFLSGRATAQTATVTADATTFAPGGGQVTLTASIVYPAGTNGITGVVVKNGGINYTTAPTVAFVGGGGTGATATATVSGGAVTAVSVTNAGSGYADFPAVTFTGGGGTGATADAAFLTPTALGFLFNIPAGWALVSTGGANVPQTAPLVGTTATLEYAYTSFPANVASFTVTVSYPAGLVGNQTITPEAIYRSPLANLAVAPLVFTPAPVAPAITTQPANVSVAAGANASFSVAASGTPAPTLKWQRSTDNGATFADLAADATYTGVTTATLSIGATSIAMNGNRFRAVAMSGASPNAISNAAVLTVTQVPVIGTQASSQSVVVGGTAVFAILASGLPAPTYQWYFTPTGSSTPQSLNDSSGKLSGTRTSTLSVSGVQAADAGDYVCVATNAGGSATSVAAQLSIADRVVRVVSQTAAPGATITVPVQLVAHGEENALGFSLNFDPALLTYQTSVLGSAAADASMNVNSSQTSTGKIGIALAKPAGATWAAGTQEIVKITFVLNAAAPNGSIATIGFGNTPIAFEVSSVTANTLPAGIQPGVITVLAGFEADMNGSGTLTITDWVKVGRIVAGLDPAPTGVDFMKADCAPRSTLGSGTLTISDWVQAGRYAAGLDPITPVGGPTSP